MDARTTTLETSPVRGVEGLHFEPRRGLPREQLLTLAIGVVILIAVLV